MDGVAAENANFSGIGLQKSEQEFDCGGLAGAVRTKQSHNLSGVHLEIYRAQGANISVVFADALQVRDHGSAACRFGRADRLESFNHDDLLLRTGRFERNLSIAACSAQGT